MARIKLEGPLSPVLRVPRGSHTEMLFCESHLHSFPLKPPSFSRQPKWIHWGLIPHPFQVYRSSSFPGSEHTTGNILIAEMLTILANFPCKEGAKLSPFCPPESILPWLLSLAWKVSPASSPSGSFKFIFWPFVSWLSLLSPGLKDSRWCFFQVWAGKVVDVHQSIFSAVKNPLRKFRDECEMTLGGRVRRLCCSRQNGQREKPSPEAEASVRNTGLFWFVFSRLEETWACNKVKKKKKSEEIQSLNVLENWRQSKRADSLGEHSWGRSGKRKPHIVGGGKCQLSPRDC